MHNFVTTSASGSPSSGSAPRAVSKSDLSVVAVEGSVSSTMDHVSLGPPRYCWNVVKKSKSGGRRSWRKCEACKPLNQNIHNWKKKHMEFVVSHSVSTHGVLPKVLDLSQSFPLEVQFNFCEISLCQHLPNSSDWQGITCFKNETRSHSKTARLEKSWLLRNPETWLRFESTRFGPPGSTHALVGLRATSDNANLKQLKHSRKWYVCEASMEGESNAWGESSAQNRWKDANWRIRRKDMVGI